MVRMTHPVLGDATAASVEQFEALHAGNGWTLVDDPKPVIPDPTPDEQAAARSALDPDPLVGTATDATFDPFAGLADTPTESEED